MRTFLHIVSIDVCEAEPQQRSHNVRVAATLCAAYQVCRQLHSFYHDFTVHTVAQKLLCRCDCQGAATGVCAAEHGDNQLQHIRHEIEVRHAVQNATQALLCHPAWQRSLTGCWAGEI